IEAEHLDPDPGSFPFLSFKEAKDQAAEEWSKRAIRTALAMTEGNISKAAVLLKMNQNALFRLIKKYDLKSNNPLQKPRLQFTVGSQLNHKQISPDLGCAFLHDANAFPQNSHQGFCHASSPSRLLSPAGDTKKP